MHKKIRVKYFLIRKQKKLHVTTLNPTIIFIQNKAHSLPFPYEEHFDKLTKRQSVITAYLRGFPTRANNYLGDKNGICFFRSIFQLSKYVSTGSRNQKRNEKIGGIFQWLIVWISDCQRDFRALYRLG